MWVVLQVLHSSSHPTLTQTLTSFSSLCSLAARGCSPTAAAAPAVTRPSATRSSAQQMSRSSTPLGAKTLSMGTSRRAASGGRPYFCCKRSVRSEPLGLSLITGAAAAWAAPLLPRLTRKRSGCSESSLCRRDRASRADMARIDPQA